MQFTSLILSVLFVASSAVIAVPSSAAAALFTRGSCKSPSCTSKCPDGTPYDCCVDYIRDPCSDHQACEEIDCLCKCEGSATTYLCNANYFVDPCKPLNGKPVDA
ncbi:hypothetical protein HYFRA_00001064 [Hymenoscyphus fraxineus]|uniref:Uncharacterized protein n=1 Tax=Hymenoscyphus fraxineus TaxID=746836 RepID=A0A9N9KR10_9HELO|nr:hypothetical protein HYFRA_00001064 [Hymenoscyphus fraxineus]